MVPGSISPPRHRALIESEGVDNRLAWTAIRQQGDDHDNQLCWLAQPFHHSSAPRAKRVTTGATAIALPLAIMDATVALSDLASCRTRRVWAKLSGRVHWLFCCVLHTRKMPGTVTFFNKGLLFHRLVGLYQKTLCQDLWQILSAVQQEWDDRLYPQHQQNALRLKLERHTDQCLKTLSKRFTSRTRTEPPRFLSFVSILLQVQFTEPSYTCGQDI
jgi:hypothetical protein